MRCIVVDGSGKDATLRIGEAPEPEIHKGEVLIEVCATAVNRADLLQRQGLYPPPPGASEILGLECSGTVLSTAADIDGWQPGDRVCALLSGGGYAERAIAPAGSLLPAPEALDLIAAAGAPETFLTCHLNLFDIAAVEPGEWVLVQGGGSGIGTSAIQLLSRHGAKVIVTAGKDETCARCRQLGAEYALNYRCGPFAPRVFEITNGKGVDVVLDCIGAPYLEQHLQCLATGGRMVVIGLMGGSKTEIELRQLLAKRLSLIGSTLRARSASAKAAIVESFLHRFGDDFAGGRVRPIVHAVLPLEQAQEGHEILAAGGHFGKVVLQVAEPA